jgi:hypothetical protein
LKRGPDEKAALRGSENGRDEQSKDYAAKKLWQRGNAHALFSTISLFIVCGVLLSRAYGGPTSSHNCLAQYSEERQ